MILPIQQLQFDFPRIFGITMDYMARYPNQDFQQNVSFKCTMEFRYALKLAMEKARSRDLSSFIRQHLDPAIKSLLDPLTIAELEALDPDARMARLMPGELLPVTGHPGTTEAGSLLLTT